MLTYKPRVKATGTDISHILMQRKDIVSRQIGQIMMSPDAVYEQPWLPCTDVGWWLIENVSGTMIVVDTATGQRPPRA